MSVNGMIWITVFAVLFVVYIFFLLLMPDIIFKFIFYKPKRSKKIPKYYVDTPHYKASQEGLKVMNAMPNDNVYIMSDDGLKLHGYFFPCGDDRKKFVIGVHGYKSYARPEFAPYIEFYNKMGYNMLLVDDRAHGPSEGDYIGFGVLDRLDILKWIGSLIKTYGEDIEILVHGVSMGGATVVSVAGEDLPPQVKGIIADCAYTSGYDILSYQMKHSAHISPDLFLPHVEKILEKKAGYNLHDITPLKQVKKAKVPMLFVHGKEDKFVPPYMADELFESCSSEKKRLLLVENAGHAESIAFDKEAYHTAIKEMFIH